MSHAADDLNRKVPPTTRWSLIVAARGPAEEHSAREALNELCSQYQRPVLHYVMRKGFSPHDAQDLTQDFFLRLAKPEFLHKADPVKGRFRSLVYSTLNHVLADAAERVNALKRGGGLHIAPLEEWLDGEIASIAPGAGLAPSNDHHFDYDWATDVVRNAMHRLEADFTRREKTREFRVLRSFLTSGEPSSSYSEAAAALNLPLGTLRAMIHRLRAQYGVLLRDEVSQTLADLRDLDDELRHLCAVLASPRNLPAGETGAID